MKKDSLISYLLAIIAGMVCSLLDISWWWIFPIAAAFGAGVGYAEWKGWLKS